MLRWATAARESAPAQIGRRRQLSSTYWRAPSAVADITELVGDEELGQPLPTSWARRRRALLTWKITIPAQRPIKFPACCAVEPPT